MSSQEGVKMGLDHVMEALRVIGDNLGNPLSYVSCGSDVYESLQEKTDKNVMVANADFMSLSGVRICRSGILPDDVLCFVYKNGRVDVFSKRGFYSIQSPDWMDSVYRANPSLN